MKSLWCLSDEKGTICHDKLRDIFGGAIDQKGRIKEQTYISAFLVSVEPHI